MASPLHTIVSQLSSVLAAGAGKAAYGPAAAMASAAAEAKALAQGLAEARRKAVDAFSTVWKVTGNLARSQAEYQKVLSRETGKAQVKAKAVGQQAGAEAGGEAAAATAEGAAAGLAAITAAIKVFVSACDQMKSTVIETVTAFKPFQVELFNRRLLDLQAVFGHIFLPVLLECVAVLRLVADYFNSLPQGFRSTMQAFAMATIAVSVLAAIVGTLAVAVVLLTSPIAVVVGLFSALALAFVKTTGGAKAVGTAIEFIEQIFAGIYEAVMAMWSNLKPVRDLLSDALSSIGETFTNLMRDLKPIAAVVLNVLGVIATVIAGAIILIITALIKFVQATTFITRMIIKLVGWLFGMAGKKNTSLPDVSRDTSSAFGKAAQGGNILTDAASVKTKIEEMILANTGTGDLQRDQLDFIKDIAGNVSKIANKDDKTAVGSREQRAGTGGIAGERGANVVEFEKYGNRNILNELFRM